MGLIDSPLSSPSREQSRLGTEPLVSRAIMPVKGRRKQKAAEVKADCSGMFYAFKRFLPGEEEAQA